MRRSIAGLPRFIVTNETAKHRLFAFLPAGTVPDCKLFVVASDDAYHLGVLSSRLHVSWALAAGGRLEDRPVYSRLACFDPFPFPAASEAQQTRIRELAEALDAHRRCQQARHPTLTLTDLYNVVEKLRAGHSLTAKEQTTHAHGLAAVVLSLHQQLDAAVAAAYGWPADLPDTELLARLVHLNQQRRQEEAAGQVRYLRPAYQAPGPQATQVRLLVQQATPPAPAEPTSRQSWPPDLAPQLLAVRALVQGASQPLTAAQVAAGFQGIRIAQVQPLLETLTALSLLRVVTERQPTYAA